MNRRRENVHSADESRTRAEGCVPMRDHAVVIAGGGPTGLMLAGELAMARVDAAVVERRPENQNVSGLRAGGLQMRTLEVLDQRGIVERFVSEGKIFRGSFFGGNALDTTDLPSRHNYFVALWQMHIERILGEWVRALGVRFYTGCEVTDFAQDDSGIDVELSNGQALRTSYLCGCDGGRSLVRKKASIDFAGWEPSTTYLMAEIETSQEPQWGIRRGEKGINALAKLEDAHHARTVLNEGGIRRGNEPTLEDVREALIKIFGTDFGLRKATYISRFSDMARQAVSYRRGRVVLAGDAAHVHSPVGGQGLNIGIQDAVNLGWKLAQVIHGTSADELLDSYHAERHPVGARLLRNTMALTAAERGDERSGALRELVSELLKRDDARRQYVAMMTALDVRYDLGEGHALLGRRMPDLDIVTASGQQRVFELLHAVRPVLLNFGEPASVDIKGWDDRVRLVNAKYTGVLQLPVLGTVATPNAVLIRPDGHVAWVGEEEGQRGLREALTAWFGPPAAA